MIDPKLQDDAALFALGELRGSERELFVNELSSCEELRRKVGGFEAVCTALVLSAPQIAPPPGLRQRILDAAVTGRNSTNAHEAREGQRKIVRFPGVVAWAAAACLATGALVLWNQNRALRDTNRELSHRADMMELRAAVLTAKVEEAGNATAQVVWDAEQQEGVLHTISLPKQAADRSYQLWIFDGTNPVPVSAGVIVSSGKEGFRFKPSKAVTNASTFAITLEKAGGVPVAEGPVYLSGQL